MKEENTQLGENPGETPTVRGRRKRRGAISISADGVRIAKAQKNTLVLIDASNGDEFLLEGHTGAVNNVAFSPDSTRLVTASEDRTVRVWDAATGKQILQLSGHRSGVDWAQFGPDGKRIISGNTIVRIWDAATGNKLLQLEGHTSLVRSIAFSPDGTRIVTASDSEDDRTVRLWDTNSGKEIARFNGIVRSIYSLSAAFSSDGALIVARSNKKAVRIWPVPPRPPELVNKAKTLIARCLTQKQRENAFLPPEPPRWCITGPGREAETDPSNWQPKWPYHTAEWRDWLAAKDRGEDPPLPTSD